jgi:hypothetical protein
MKFCKLLAAACCLVPFLSLNGQTKPALKEVTKSGMVSGTTYSWPAYQPTLDYNFREEFPSLEMPSRDLNDCPQVVGSQSSGWWTFRWGPQANPLVTTAAITPMLERMNTEFAYFRDSMGWPPDKRVKYGYRSAIYLFGSGLCTDNASNTELGGWQSSIYYNGQHWPMVLASYYPVYSFDPACNYSDRNFQMGAMVHEGIHSILADLPGCKNAAWFHEGGNTWLQQEAESRRSGDYSSMGFLNVCPFIAPFMPIECYSGWLQDGSFGGPSAEGVNRYNGNQQLCTWRNLLGGNQYGNTFPVFLGQTLGTGSIAWIWRYCPSRVLKGIADTLGDAQTRRLITEYRAKQALLDMREWTGAIKRLLDSNFKSSIRAEWQPSWLNPDVWIATPYAKTTNDGNGLLTPESRTTPGWSGANQIPLFVEGDTIIVNFQPIGKNMSCQLCYRTKDGSTVYSHPVTNGDCTLVLEKKPANSVVFAVICNTDYEYKGETTRKAHYDYRLQLIKGVVRAANIHVKWYDWVKDLKDIISGTGDDTVFTAETLLFPNPLDSNGGILNIRLTGHDYHGTSIEIRDAQGRKIYREPMHGDLSINANGILKPGIYFVTVKTPTSRKTQKLVVI